jgi:SsrA-binding protein
VAGLPILCFIVHLQTVRSARLLEDRLRICYNTFSIPQMTVTEMAGKTIAVNRRARHDYDVQETCDAGLVLTGTEIKSIRAGRVTLRDAHARARDGELWLFNMHVSPYEQGNRYNVDPLRPRKLLLHRSQIQRFAGKVQEKGLALIPLRVYLQRGYAKVEIALARGRRQFDKREAIAERDAQREKERALRVRQTTGARAPRADLA